MELKPKDGKETHLSQKTARGALAMLFIFALLAAAGGCQPAPEETVNEDPVPNIEDLGGENEIPDEVDFEPLPELEKMLDPVHPDEPLEHTLGERFSLSNSLERLVQMREAGTEHVSGEQQMAFENWAGAVEGTLLKQEYEIKKVELELARYRYAAGEIDAIELEEAEEAYDKALEAFLSFWETFSILD